MFPRNLRIYTRNAPEFESELRSPANQRAAHFVRRFLSLHSCHHFRFERACARADAAIDFVRELERPSRRAADAFFATFGDVCLVLRFTITDTPSVL